MLGSILCFTCMYLFHAYKILLKYSHYFTFTMKNTEVQRLSNLTKVKVTWLVGVGSEFEPMFGLQSLGSANTSIIIIPGLSNNTTCWILF